MRTQKRGVLVVVDGPERIGVLKLIEQLEREVAERGFSVKTVLNGKPIRTRKSALAKTFSALADLASFYHTKVLPSLASSDLTITDSSGLQVMIHCGCLLGLNEQQLKLLLHNCRQCGPMADLLFLVDRGSDQPIDQLYRYHYLTGWAHSARAIEAPTGDELPPEVLKPLQLSLKELLTQ